MLTTRLLFVKFCTFEFRSRGLFPTITDIKNMSYLRKRVQSFKHAFRGIRELFRETPNARIHLQVAIAAILLGVVFRISTGEWLAIVIAMGGVFAMEAINTALETLSDYACKNEIHPLIRKAKDLAAAAVLIAALGAVVVGILIFTPKIF